ncbi:MAG TPA: glycosyltransferase family 2 protein, partial [Aquabacterium sp.]|nr:glycosyltransferase family 2 protein [Aquabacterium sp.]
MTDVSSAASGATSPRQSTFASISVVLPAYNEAGNLPSTLADLTAQLPSMSPHWEVVVVDDGSRDETALVMQPWVRQYGVRYVQLSRNFGKEAALSAGIDHAHGDVVILMDADGQHPVDLLPDLLTAWREGADMVCAVRASRDDESWSKRLGTALFYRIVNAGSKVTIPENASDFRL